MVAIISLFFKLRDLMTISEFKLRLISTIVLTVLFLALFLLGNPFFVFTLTCLFSLLLYEFEVVAGNKIKKIPIFKIAFLQFILILYLFFRLYDPDQILFNNVNILIFFSLLINSFFKTRCFNIVFFTFSNLIILSFFSLINILTMNNGLNLFLYLVILISVMDIFAYLGGKLIGNKKIIPKISQGKTIEGTLVGLVFTVCVSFFIKDLTHFDNLIALSCGLIIGILAFTGDILESIVKRKIGIKDSGKLIPGHGGLMDRFDGYFIVLPFFYFFLFLMIR